MPFGKLIIREVTNVEDLILVRNIALNTWPHTFAEILTPEQIKYMLEMMYSVSSLSKQFKEKHHRFALGFDNGNPVGFAGYELSTELGLTKIHKLYFLPESHGKGFGKAMMDYLINVTSNNQLNTITLNVNRFNKAISFYKHLGFTISGEEVIDIDSGYVMDDYIMHLHLT